MDAKIAARESLLAVPTPDSAPARGAGPRSRLPGGSPRAGRKFDDYLQQQSDGASAKRPSPRTLERPAKLEAAAPRAPLSPRASKAPNSEQAAAAAPRAMEPPPGLSLASPNLRRWGDLVQAQPGALGQTGIAPLLGGEWERLDGAALPGLIAQHPFLEAALAEDGSTFMSQSFTVGQLASLLGLSEQVLAQGAELGLDLNEVVTPAQFFRSLGVDPSRILAEMSRFKDKLATSGLQSLLPRSRKAKAGKEEAALAELGQGESSGQSKRGPKAAAIPSAALGAGAALADPQAASALRPADAKLSKESLNTTKLAPMAEARPADPAVAEQAPAFPGNPFAADAAASAGTRGQAVKGGAAQSMLQAPPASPSKGLTGAQAPLPESLAPLASAAEKAGVGLQMSLAGKPKPTDAAGARPVSSALGLQPGDLGLVAAQAGASPLGGQPDATPSQAPKAGGLSDGQMAQQALLALNSKATSGNAGVKPLDGPSPTALGPDLALAAQTAQLGQSLSASDFADAEAAQADEDAAQALVAQAASASPDSKPTSASAAPLRQTGAARPLGQELSPPTPAVAGRRNDERMHLQAYGRTNQADARTEAAPATKDSEASGKERRTGSSTQAPVSGADALAFNNPAESLLTVANDAKLGEGLQNGLSQEARAEVVEQVMDRSQMMLKHGGGNALVRVQDKDMGEISLAVQVQGDEVRLKMVSPNEQVRNLLGTDLAGLKDSLAAQNMQLVEVDIRQDLNQRQQEQTMSQFAFAGQQGQQQNHGQSETQRLAVPEQLRPVNVKVGSLSESLQKTQPLSISQLQRHIEVMV